ncbi:hypothetical protein BVC71_00300 [Marivivens niveibacter]|uniref:PepSY domain-containing protein n=1 Tax=Marivivens niveibacter TaxID=1930667 RepID=A0A251WZT8_9RHOB|nr:hypothetical protein [Marivivens niveibacter]OUD09999.1 hypothetical protein BVC71_00300 [Marivivens niveibacter]
MKLLRMALLGAGLLWGGIAHAQSTPEEIAAQLIAEGYTDVQIERTLLGRVRIVASGADGRREIVIQPTTGVILRDRVQGDNPRPTPRDDRDPMSPPSAPPDGADNDDARPDRPQPPDDQGHDRPEPPDRDRNDKGDERPPQEQ